MKHLQQENNHIQGTFADDQQIFFLGEALGGGGHLFHTIPFSILFSPDVSR